MADPQIHDPIWRIQNLYLIKDKKARVSRLSLNRGQRILADRVLAQIAAGEPLEEMVLKFRQGGVSTFFLLLHLDRTVFTRNVNTGILADLRENLGYLFEIIRFAHESMPADLRPELGSDSKTELSFPAIRSKIMVSLAFKSTTLHGLHVSERAFIDDENVRRTLGACTPGAWITQETTANGFNAFREEWVERKGLSRPGVFLPWPLQAEYRIPEPGVPDDLPPLERTKEEQSLAARMQREYGIVMDDAQFRFRRKKKRDLKNLYYQEMAEDDDTCFLASGGSFFDGRKINVLLREASEYLANNPPLRTDEESVVFETPMHRHVYVIGADVAEGTGTDYSTAAVLCCTCGKTAARYKAKCGVDSFYRTLYDLGMKYNRALLAPEINNHGHAVVMGLREKNYPHLYRSERRNRAQGTKEVLKFGWETTTTTKPIMLDNLKVALEGNSDEDEENFEPGLLWLDTEFLKETLGIRQEGGKIGAVPGKNDDLTMAYAIAWQLLLRTRARSAGSLIGGIRTDGEVGGGR